MRHYEPDPFYATAFPLLAAVVFSDINPYITTAFLVIAPIEPVRFLTAVYRNRKQRHSAPNNDTERNARSLLGPQRYAQTVTDTRTLAQRFRSAVTNLVKA